MRSSSKCINRSYRVRLEPKSDGIHRLEWKRIGRKLYDTLKDLSQPIRLKELHAASNRLGGPTTSAAKCDSIIYFYSCVFKLKRHKKCQWHLNHQLERATIIFTEWIKSPNRQKTSGRSWWNLHRAPDAVLTRSHFSSFLYRLRPRPLKPAAASRSEKCPAISYVAVF